MIAGVSITTLLLVLAAGIGAGFVGYAVGASSLISYPALLAFGIPPVLSNTTNTVGVCGTGIGGLLSARRELKGQGVRVAVYACIGLVGGIIGGLLLLELPAKVFEFAVPPLILFSALIIAINPRKKLLYEMPSHKRFLNRSKAKGLHRSPTKQIMANCMIRGGYGLA